MLAGFFVGCGSWTVGVSAAEPLPAADLDFFEKQVRPLLVKRCFECHGGTRAEGGLSLASAEGWKTRGRQRTSHRSGEAGRLPADRRRQLRVTGDAARGAGGRLPADEIAVLTTWAELGAPDPRSGAVLGGMAREEARARWAFQPLPAGGPLEPPPVSPASVLPTNWGELVQVHDDWAIFQASPDELPDIDSHSL